MRDLHLIPAYGRDYKSKASVLADWEDGKDFRLVPEGCYVSKRDLSEGSPCPEFSGIIFRYAKLRKSFVVFPNAD